MILDNAGSKLEMEMAMKLRTHVLWLGAMLLSFQLYAATPPLSETARIRKSTLIVEGTVTENIETEEVLKKPQGSLNAVHKISMEAETVLKGSVEVGETVEFHYWRQKTRPPGWAGDQGQNSDIPVGSQIRAFLVQEPNGNKIILLNPNGFDILED